jgi:hypothetical protein
MTHLLALDLHLDLDVARGQPLTVRGRDLEVRERAKEAAVPVDQRAVAIEGDERGGL